MIEISRAATRRWRLSSWRRRQPVSAEPSPVAGPRGPGVWATAAWVVVIALACLTTLAAAEVSVMLALVYWSALVAIFLSPRGGGVKTLPLEALAGDELAGSGIARDHLVDDLHDVVPPASNTPVLEPPADEGDSREQPAWEAETARPRRGRVRVRKSAKPAGEPIMPPVTWVRVGPGRFVRADVAVAGAHAEADLETPDAMENPTLETGEETPPEPVNPIEPTASDLEPLGAARVTDEGPEVEEYGNAPSAFEPSLSDALDEIAPVDVLETVDLAGEAIVAGKWRRGIMRMVSNAGRRHQRGRFARGGNRSRVPMRSDAPQPRMRPYTGRAARGIPQVERGFRPRSPPDHETRGARRALIEMAPRPGDHERPAETPGPRGVCLALGVSRGRPWEGSPLTESTSSRHN